MNQSLVFSVFWKENELQRLIGTPCQWLVLLNVVFIRASNKAVHQLTTNSNISFSLHFQSFNVYGSPYVLSKPIIMPLLWCLCLNCTELRTFLCLLREGWCETTRDRKPGIAKSGWSTCSLLIAPGSQSEDCILKIIAVINNAAVLRVTKWNLIKVRKIQLP